ncbi:MAG: hypothetical protein ACI81O_002253 [Cyclobacteriaceae bacterium]
MFEQDGTSCMFLAACCTPGGRDAGTRAEERYTTGSPVVD